MPLKFVTVRSKVRCCINAQAGPMIQFLRTYTKMKETKLMCVTGDTQGHPCVLQASGCRSHAQARVRRVPCQCALKPTDSMQRLFRKLFKRSKVPCDRHKIVFVLKQEMLTLTFSWHRTGSHLCGSGGTCGIGLILIMCGPYTNCVMRERGHRIGTYHADINTLTDIRGCYADIKRM